MPDKPPLSIGFNVQFTEAIAAAERVTTLPQTYYSPAFQGIFRQKAFSIAGIASLDQLQAVNDSLAKFMKNGGSFNAWKKEQAVKDLKLPPHRIENIWRTNLQGNYMRGRWEVFTRNAATRPYLMYDAINDSRVRPSHLAHDGVIRPVGDPFWKTHTPPIGWQCRCSLISLTEAKARARSGFNAKNEGLGLNKVPTNDDGSIAQPDPGWDYNPYEDSLKTWKPDPVRYHPKLRPALAETTAIADAIPSVLQVMQTQPQAEWTASILALLPTLTETQVLALIAYLQTSATEAQATK